tara:strand:+ start:11 stop:268 length:258 start_codon:yes stop_codon:yes gene_type:complete
MTIIHQNINHKKNLVVMMKDFQNQTGVEVEETKDITGLAVETLEVVIEGKVAEGTINLHLYGESENVKRKIDKCSSTGCIRKNGL